MSSNIRLQRICQICGNEFTAKTTVTKYCSNICTKRAYRSRKRESKIERSNDEVRKIKVKPIEELKAKEFLSVRDASMLLGISNRTVYRLIKSGIISAINLGDRMTRIKRSEIDALLVKPETNKTRKEALPIDINDCYNLTEVQEKYDISEKALYEIIKRNAIPKIKKGWYAYVPKKIIDELLT